jgi:hypothetical protein
MEKEGEMAKTLTQTAERIVRYCEGIRTPYEQKVGYVSLRLLESRDSNTARSTLAQKVLETVATTITNLRTLPANESTPEGRRDRAHLDVMAEGADEVADALRDLFRREGVEVMEAEVNQVEMDQPNE